VADWAGVAVVAVCVMAILLSLHCCPPS